MVNAVAPSGEFAAAADRSWVLEAVEVSASYGRTPALVGASLSVRAARSVAILGESGSGKSTMLHCLAGLRQPDSGAVLYDGGDLAQLGDVARSRIRLREMGIVFQFGELVPELTVGENVALPLWAAGADRTFAAARAAELLEAFGLGETVDRIPGQLSGGQQQRAAVARALVHDPKIVFADEPTGSLDSLNAENVMDSLLAQTTVQRAALVLVTHEPRYAERCDEVFVMRDGALRPR